MQRVRGGQGVIYRLGVFLVAMALGLLVYLLEEWGWYSSAELTAYDMLMRMRFSRTPSTSVAILAIDQKSLNKLGDLPWDQSIHAKVIRALNRSGAKSIVFDMTLPEGGPALYGALAEKKNVILATTFDPMRSTQWTPTDLEALVSMERFVMDDHMRYSKETQAYPYYYFVPPPADLEQHAGGVGVVVGGHDSGSIIRSAMLSYLSTVQYPVPSQALPSGFAMPTLIDHPVAIQGLPLAAARLVMGNPEADFDFGGSISLFSDTATMMQIPIDSSGATLINFTGTSGTYTYYSADDLLRGSLPAGVFSGRTVIVGAANQSPSKMAVLNTPYSGMPKVEITANAVATILDRAFIVRSRAEALLVMFFLAFLLGIVFPFVPTFRLGVVSFAAALFYIVLAEMVFQASGHAWPVIAPVVLILVAAVAAGLLNPVMFITSTDSDD